jgi:ComF family protein
VLESLRSVISFIFTERCVVCGRDGELFCGECGANVMRVDYEVSCPLCGRFVGKRILCGECMEENRNYEAGFFLYYYLGPIRDAIHAFKFERKKRVGRVLIRMEKDRISELAGKFDYILPIPVTERRLKERGFNQAYIISEEISKITGIKVLSDVLIKKKETKDQYTLSLSERRKNVRGAFTLRDERAIKGKRILIVDDLFTTGNTLMEASRVVSRAQPGSVSVFALARAL